MKKSLLLLVLLTCLSPVFAQNYAWVNFGSQTNAQQVLYNNGQIVAMAPGNNSGNLYVVLQTATAISVYKNSGGAAGAWTNVGKPYFSGSIDSRVKIVLDNSETPYVVVKQGDSKIAVLKYDGTNWVNVGAAGFSASTIGGFDMAIYNNVPYVAYVDNSLNGKITVQKFNGTTWTTVGSGGLGATFNDYVGIKVGTDGLPIVIFDYLVNHTLYSMKFSGTSWTYLGSSTGFGTLGMASTGGTDYQAIFSPFKFVLDNNNYP